MTQRFLLQPAPLTRDRIIFYGLVLWVFLACWLIGSVPQEFPYHNLFDETPLSDFVVADEKKEGFRTKLLRIVFPSRTLKPIKASRQIDIAHKRGLSP